MQYTPLRFVLSIGLVAALSVGCKAPEPTDLKNVLPNTIEAAGEKNTDKNSSSPNVTTDVKPAQPPVDTTQPKANKAEQESCTPKLVGEAFSASDCKEGLVCAPDTYDNSKGSCRVSCGTTVKGKTTKSPEKCSADRTCQTTLSLTFDELGTYCMPQQTKRDGPCYGVSDDQACSNNRICAVGDVSKDENGQPVASSFLCRDSCAYGKATATNECSSGEQCVVYPYESTPQNDDKGQPLVCTESKCTGDMAGCECDSANGFQCAALIPGIIAFCERKAGICATPVPFSSASDFDGMTFAGTSCNEVKGHAFCDNGLFKGVENPGQAICVQLNETSGDGFCFAFCSSPSLDYDGDGKIAGKEAGEKFGCPANYTCSTNLGRHLGLIAALPDTSAANGKKSCDPAKCEAGKPCPEQCGVGDAECLSFPGKGGKTVSFCGAPFGNCEEPTMTPR